MTRPLDFPCGIPLSLSRLSHLDMLDHGRKTYAKADWWVAYISHC